MFADPIVRFNTQCMITKRSLRLFHWATIRESEDITLRAWAACRSWSLSGDVLNSACHRLGEHLWLDTLLALRSAGTTVDYAIAWGFAFEVAPRFNRAGDAGNGFCVDMRWIIVRQDIWHRKVLEYNCKYRQGRPRRRRGPWKRLWQSHRGDGRTCWRAWLGLFVEDCKDNRRIREG